MTARRRRRLAAIVLLAAAGVAGDAWGLGLCRKRARALVVRETCRRREARLDLLLLGTPGSAGPAGAPGTAGPIGPGVAVRDAVGRRVGVSVFVGEGEAITAILGGRLVGVRVNTAGVAQGVFFLHEQANCADPPLQHAELQPPFASVEGTTAFVTEEPIVLHTVKASETLNDPNCAAKGGTVLSSGRCCSPLPTTALAGPVAPLDLTELQYTPPLRLTYE